jgi:hypothetical protein
MFSTISKRVTYANVAMTLALVFAMSGGAFAASKYLITSTKQIKPSVLASLKGAAGKTGPAGPQGPAGPTGAQGAKGENGAAGQNGTNGEAGKEGAAGKNGTNGKEGSPWTAGGTLPSKKTETGVWTATLAAGPFALASISFPIPLSKALGGPACEKEEPTCSVHYVKLGATVAGACEGTVTVPTAAPGNLCVYEQEGEGAGIVGERVTIVPTSTGVEALPPGSSTGAGISGAVLVAETEGAAFALGSWAVTAE